MHCARQSRLFLLPLAAVTALVAFSVSVTGPAAAKSKERAEKKDPYALTTRVPGGAMLAIVSLDDQRVTIYDADGAVLRAPVSSGQTGLETPVGIYAVLQKKAEHYSNLYDDAAMPFMQRITWSGVALHGGALPGYPASHGCVRMPKKFAERIFDLTRLGLRVIVARDDVAPVAIEHPLLFKRTPYHEGAGLVTKAAALVGIGQPEPGEEPADVAARAQALQAIKEAKSAEAETIAKEAEPARASAKKLEPDMKRAQKALRAAEKVHKRAAERAVDAAETLTRANANEASDKAKARAQQAKEQADAKLAEAQTKFDAIKSDVQPRIDAFEQADAAAKVLEEKRDAALAEAGEAARKLKPVSVFISRATQTLYVRQGFEPIFESPVTIRDPRKSIGTYTYTAVGYGEDGRQMRWNVVSVGGGSGAQSRDYDRYDTAYDDYDYYDRPRRRRHQPATKADATPTDVAAATAALDRITIPEEVAARISALVLPASSLIVSDEEAHKETGPATDFVVLISGEPQGGIKKRPKPVDPYADYYGYDDYYDRRRGRRGYQYRGPFFSFW
jgi:hypothetical protein